MQPPQCSELLDGSAHNPPQSTWGATQLTVQVPPWQVCPARHAEPQPPQLVASRWISTQTPLHDCAGATHAPPLVPVAGAGSSLEHEAKSRRPMKRQPRVSQLIGALFLVVGGRTCEPFVMPI